MVYAAYELFINLLYNINNKYEMVNMLHYIGVVFTHFYYINQKYIVVGQKLCFLHDDEKHYNDCEGYGTLLLYIFCMVC